ncbi:MAG: TIGR02302 family protein, partial [Xanthobacteraceae bacterium]
RLDVAVSGGVAEAEPSSPTAAPDTATKDGAATGAEERRFTIAGDGTAEVRAPARQAPWRFIALADQSPRIALAKAPERRARGGLELSYKIEDDYGVTEAKARFKAIAEAPAVPAAKPEPAEAARPLFDPPDFPLALPNARTRNGVGQTVKDLSDSPYAGAEVELTLAARDEAGNEGVSEPLTLRLPQRVFTKPLARALVEQRRLLALDARQSETVATALDALLIAPEIFAPEAGQYLGLRSIAAELSRADSDDALRGVVGSLWALALAIEDANITDVEKELRAAQDALREALERGASDEEIKKLTDRLRAALDNYMRQLAEQLRDNPQQLARPLDSNTRVMRQQDLDNMISRMEQLSRSGDKEAARQLLEQLQQMLENLQMAQPSQGDPGGDMEQALNELGDMIRKQQQLRDRTFKEGQDARRERRNGERGDRNAMQGLQQDQQALRDRLRQLQEEMARRGMGQRPGQREQGSQGQQGREGRGGDQGEQGAGDALGEADSQMGSAEGQLGEGNAGSAADAQGRALEALRRGAQNLAEAMQQQMGEGGGEGDGPGDRLGRQGRNGERTDPLGRPLRGRDYGDDQSVKIPGEIDVQRVRRILEELRRRLSDPARPQIELDYLERLLKDY